MTPRRPLGTGPAPDLAPAPTAEALAAASRYVRHGETFLGGAFVSCTCPKVACGGVAPDDYDDDCPDHGGGRTPVQLWHWAAACPGPMAPPPPFRD